MIYVYYIRVYTFKLVRNIKYAAYNMRLKFHCKSSPWYNSTRVLAILITDPIIIGSTARLLSARKWIEFNSFSHKSLHSFNNILASFSLATTSRSSTYIASSFNPCSSSMHVSCTLIENKPLFFIICSNSGNLRN